jgi:SagB-type dehydrogenase family enzyme
MRNILLLFVAMLTLIALSTEVAMSKTKEIRLPPPKTKSAVSLEEAIAKRHSIRSFSNKDLTEEQISQLLWAAQGITSGESSHAFRAAPSAGALYPIDVYLVGKNGLFRYLPQGHKIELLNEKDLRKNLSSAALGQLSVNDAAVDLVICGIPSRITGKYGERGIKYMYMEAGHIAQNIHLEATALGLGSVPVGAFNDKLADECLIYPRVAMCSILFPLDI